MVPSEKRDIEFEDLLEEIGDFGKYQKRLILFFLAPVSIALPVFAMNILFLINAPEHWCHVSEIAASNITVARDKKMFAGPGEKSRCYVYELNYTDILMTDQKVPWNQSNVLNDANLVPCKDGWEYDTSHFDETAASKWNMVCENNHYTSLALTLTNAGGAVGTYFYGTLGDKIGRRPVFFIIIFMTTVTAIASLLVSNLTAFLVLRTINGGVMSSLFQLPFVIVLELVGPDRRNLVNAVPNICWAIGLSFLPLIAYWTRHWMTLGFSATSLAAIMFGYWRFLPESPRWLVSKEKYAESVDVMMDIAKVNGKKVDRDDLLKKIKVLGERVHKEKEAVNNSPLDLLKYPNLRKKFLIVTYCWVANDFAYYGLQYNLPHLDGNPFMNFFLLSAVEFPGLFAIWYLMGTWGRRWSSASFLFLAGVACLAVAVIPEHIPYVAVVCSLIGKFGSTSSFMAIYLQSSELYPTTVRSVGMGITGGIGCIAIVIAPFIVYLANIAKYIPFLIIGLTAVTAALSATLLPETLNEILPQTIKDGELFGQDQNYWTCRPRKLPSDGNSASDGCSKKRILKKPKILVVEVK